MTPSDTAPAVSARGLGKRYEIGASAAKVSLYDRLASLPRALIGRNPTPHPSIWAVKDVSFELPVGQVLGVLGRNGSGKSTLMKILARVTAPTAGSAVIRGRVGALLQVGTGFHPELTGRDNIALSGTILGMSRRETDAVQDQIIGFASIGEFLDTPVKYYSSGMYLRLAFSVSAYLPADIMLVDEVLAVGDAQFQQKCRERIREVVGEGRSVLFVSHQLDAVRSICDTAIVLDEGRLRFGGDTAEAIAFYNDEIIGRTK